MKSALIAVLMLLATGCHRHDTYYKDYEGTKEGPFVYWIEHKPVSNRIGVCAEVYALRGGGGWGGENHRRDAPWDEETKSHVGFARFKNQQDAEAWGDNLCPN